MALSVTHLIGFGTRQAVAGQGGGVTSLSISGTPVLTATEGVAYTGFTATAEGGDPPYTFSLVGTWPTGISINSSTGEVSGTPTEDGTFASLSVRVTDSSSGTRDLPTFTLEVDPSVATDPHFANVKLLVGFDGTDGATSATDESPVGRTLTFNGNAQLDTAAFKFGTASLLCDGTTDFVSAADSADWDLSDANSDEFTIEAWIRRNAVGDINRTIVAQTASGQGAFSFRLPNQISTTELVFNLSNSGTANDVAITTSGAGVTASVWHHVAVDKDSSGKIRVYANGVMAGSATPGNSAMFNSTAVLSIGADSDGGRSFHGWIDEIRITKGVARYASDGGFTPPTAAFPRS